MRRLRWLIAGVAAVVVAIVGGTWIYINVIRDDAPERLSFDTRDQATTTSGARDPGDGADNGSIAGTWTVTSASIVGYRVAEVLFGQDSEAVGRTSDVTGTVVIEGTTVTEASFAVDMTTVESDESRRDDQFRGRIMDTDTYPTATFKLTETLDFAAVPAEGAELAVTATGSLTLRGTTRPVTIDLLARQSDGNLEISGSLIIVFDGWGIPDPSNVVASVGDSGELELLLVLAR